MEILLFINSSLGPMTLSLFTTNAVLLNFRTLDSPTFVITVIVLVIIYDITKPPRVNTLSLISNNNFSIVWPCTLWTVNGYCDLITKYDCPYAARNLNLTLGRDKDTCFSSSVFTVIEFFPKFSVVTLALLTNPYCWHIFLNI